MSILRVSVPPWLPFRRTAIMSRWLKTTRRGGPLRTSGTSCAPRSTRSSGTASCSRRKRRSRGRSRSWPTWAASRWPRAACWPWSRRASTPWCTGRPRRRPRWPRPAWPPLPAPSRRLRPATSAPCWWWTTTRSTGTCCRAACCAGATPSPWPRAGETALEPAAPRAAFDLVLLDVMMPGISGLEVLDDGAARHALAPTCRSSWPRPRTAARTSSRRSSLGANDYVTKPLDFPVVLARVETPPGAQARDGRDPAPGQRPGAAQPFHPPDLRPLPERRGRGRRCWSRREGLAAWAARSARSRS